MTRILFLMLLIFCSNLSAGTIHPSKKDDQYVEYGKEYKHIVELNCREAEHKQLYSASAVIISPNWALTAAHVVKDMNIAVIVKEKKEYNVNKIIWHKDFKEEVFGNNDIALLYTKDDFGMEFYPELYTESNEIGELAAVAGYGITGNFNTGAVRYDSKRRAGTNEVERIEENILVCSASRDNPSVLEFLTASGDSGGGLFIKGKLAGINSIVFSENKSKTNSIYGNYSGHTRVSKYIDWIKRKMENKNENEIQSISK